MMEFSYKTLKIDQEIASTEMCKHIVEKFPNAEQIVDSANQETVFSKSTLHLRKQKGRFLKSCPGTTHYLCCGYYVLSIAHNCGIGCSYCILQDYLKNSNTMSVFCNTDALFSELNEILDADPGHFYRIGTGEFTDSLLLDYISDYNLSLIPYFMTKRNAILEIKSKLDYIDNLKRFSPQRKIISSWSVNTADIVQQEEGCAVSLDKRLEAARICQDLGYLIGFHFDPMIYYDGWEKEYHKVIENIFAVIDPENIAWISLGTLRFMPTFKEIMIKNHPYSPLPYGEFIPGMDGKMRYIKTIRLQMYKSIVSHIRSLASDVFVYFCMESSEIWEKTLGWTPNSNEEFSDSMNTMIKKKITN